MSTHVTKRLKHLEAQLPDATTRPADLSPEQREYVQRLEGIVNDIIGNLPPAYAELVTADLQRMAVTPCTYPEAQPPEMSWLVDGTLSVLSFSVLQMARYALDGRYDGRLAFPESVCESLTYHTKVQPMWDEPCPACGFLWLTRNLRERLAACPACSKTWPPRVNGHELSVIIGSRKWLSIPPSATLEERRRVGRQAVARFGTDGARQWLETLDIPPAVADAVMEASAA